MQPQTMNAATSAQKITSGITCIVIVVFSVAPNTTTSHYKTFGVSSLAQYLWQLGRGSPPWLFLEIGVIELLVPRCRARRTKRAVLRRTKARGSCALPSLPHRRQRTTTAADQIPIRKLATANVSTSGMAPQ